MVKAAKHRFAATALTIPGRQIRKVAKHKQEDLCNRKVAASEDEELPEAKRTEDFLFE